MTEELFSYSVWINLFPLQQMCCVTGHVSTVIFPFTCHHISSDFELLHTEDLLITMHKCHLSHYTVLSVWWVIHLAIFVPVKVKHMQ